MGFLFSVLLLVPEPNFVPAPQFVPVPIFKTPSATKRISVVDVPGKPGSAGYWEAGACPRCPSVWVPGTQATPPTYKEIEVDTRIDRLDEEKLVEYHHRLGPASCGMSWCVTHRTQELVDEQGNPAPPGARAKEPIEQQAVPGITGDGRGGWRLGRRLRGR